MTAVSPEIGAILDWLRATAPGAQLSSDSRGIAAGDIFFAFPGDSADGRAYIPQAIEKGTRAVVHEEQGFAWNPAWKVAHLAVPGLKRLAGHVANAFYDRPDADMCSIAVTGTNG